MALVVFLGLVASAASHLWFREPEAVRGVDNPGGTTGPCNGGEDTADAPVSTYTGGQSASLTFRVNKHGNAPFTFSLVDGSGDTHILAEDISYEVTAEAGDFNQMYVPVDIPNIVCEGCMMYVSGMGNGETGAWYNCAKVDIVAGSPEALVELTELSPLEGAVNGGYDLTITGTNFMDSEQLACKFDLVVVPATFISTTQIRCKVPARNLARPASFEITLEGNIFSSSGMQFAYTGEDLLPVVSSVSPRAGPGGTEITVNGNHFYSTVGHCKFGENATSAVVINDKQMKCTVPADFMGGKAEIFASIDGSPFSEKSATFTYAATAQSGPTPAQSGGIAIAVFLCIGVVAGVAFFVYKKGYVSKAAPSSWGGATV